MISLEADKETKHGGHLPMYSKRNQAIPLPPIYTHGNITTKKRSHPSTNPYSII